MITFACHRLCARPCVSKSWIIFAKQTNKITNQLIRNVAPIAETDGTDDDDDDASGQPNVDDDDDDVGDARCDWMQQRSSVEPHCSTRDVFASKAANELHFDAQRPCRVDNADNVDDVAIDREQTGHRTSISTHRFRSSTQTGVADALWKKNSQFSTKHHRKHQ